jgi:hypothetical protein
MNCAKIVPEVPERREEGGIRCGIGRNEEVTVPFRFRKIQMPSMKEGILVFHQFTMKLWQQHGYRNHRCP